MLNARKVGVIWAFTNRAFFRYLPALGTLLLSRQLLHIYGINVYADFALFVSLAAALPIIDFGHGNNIILGGGNPARLSNGLVYSFALILLTIAGSWLLILMGFSLIKYVAFLIAVVLLLPIYLLSRHLYVVYGPDNYNLRCMKLYPLLMSCIVLLCHFKGFSYSTAAIISALAVIFSQFVSGLRAKDFLLLKEQICSIKNNTSFAFGDRRNMHLLLEAVIAFIGAWSNILFLRGYGHHDALVDYDLVWRLSSVTMFAQIVLSHSLPTIARDLATKGSSTSGVYNKLLQQTIFLSMTQLLVVSILWYPYQIFLSRPIDLSTLVCGTTMSIVFSLAIPGNYILQVRGKFGLLHFSFVSSALVAIAFKYLWIKNGLTANEAFLSTAIGYGVGTLLLHIFVKQVQEC